MAYAMYEHNERASNQAITSNYEIYYEHSVMTLVQATTKTILNTLNLLMMVEIVVEIPE